MTSDAELFSAYDTATLLRVFGYAVFEMAEVAVPRELFEQILRLIDGLPRRPAPTED